MSDNLEVPKEGKYDKLHTLIKGAIGSIPLPGSSLAAEVFGIILMQPVAKRRDAWMEAVAEAVLSLSEKLENFSIDKLREDEEFVSFLMEATQIALKNHQEEKLNLLQNSLQNFFRLNDASYDRKYSFLKIIESITATHLEILSFIVDNETHIIESIRGYQALYDHYVQKNTTISPFNFRSYVQDLHNYSLIRISKDFIDFIRGGGYATDEGAPSIKVLDNTREFMDFISRQ